MALERATVDELDIERLAPSLEATVLTILHGIVEFDGYNRLVLETGLSWRDVSLVRALRGYLQQLRVPYAREYLAATLWLRAWGGRRPGEEPWIDHIR